MSTDSPSPPAIRIVSRGDLGHQQQVDDRHLLAAEIYKYGASTLRSPNQFGMWDIVGRAIGQVQGKRLERLRFMNCVELFGRHDEFSSHQLTCRMDQQTLIIVSHIFRRIPVRY